MKRYNKILTQIFLALLVIIPTSVFAVYGQSKNSDTLSAFIYYVNVSPKISVPTVIEVLFNKNNLSQDTFAVYNNSTKELEPYFLNDQRKEIGKSIEVLGISNGETSNLTDGNNESYLEFPLLGKTGVAGVSYVYNEPITSSSLYFSLPDNVARPDTVSINATVAGKDTVVLAPAKVTSATSILFPKTTASEWRIAFTFSQPLRIGEMNFEGTSLKTGNMGVRFLAEPGQTYKIYFDSDRYVDTRSTKESGNLSSNAGVVSINSPEYVTNELFVPVDQDEDSVKDAVDNCPNNWNPDQKDSDNNGVGDACEDYDRDGVVGSVDNCPNTPNAYQEDTDADGIGNVCDTVDNRVTERLPWLPWAGIGAAALVLLGLFALALRRPKKDLQNLQ